MLAIIVGIRAEQMAIGRRLDILERKIVDTYPVALGSYADEPVLLCRTGMGEARVQRMEAAVLGAYPPTAMVSARVASSVPDDLQIGDLVLCRKTHLWRDMGPLVRASQESDARLLTLGEQAARAAGINYVVKSALTVAPLRPVPLDRNALSGSATLGVVDTEGYWLAEIAFARQIPFLSVRAALGRAYDRMPQSLTMAAESGYLHPGRALVQTMKRPDKLPDLIQLTAAIRKAARSLSSFMREFLREWSAEP